MVLGQKSGNDGKCIREDQDPHENQENTGKLGDRRNPSGNLLEASQKRVEHQR